MLCLLACTAIAAQANIHLSGTAYSTYFKQCSSWLGARGIIKKQDTMKIDQKYINAFCENQACDAEIHMSLDCTGDAIGIILFTKQNGITNVTPVDNKEGYALRKIDNNTAIIEKTITVQGLLGSMLR